MWNCIQIEEFDSNTGRLRRKLIFDEISNKRQTITKYRNVHFKPFYRLKHLKWFKLGFICIISLVCFKLCSAKLENPDFSM